MADALVSIIALFGSLLHVFSGTISTLPRLLHEGHIGASSKNHISIFRSFPETALRRESEGFLL